MNYKESKIILENIKKAKNIVINCHRNPDADSIGSSLAMFHVIRKMGKRVEIICPSKKLLSNLSYLKNFDKIKSGVNFSTFDFSRFEIFIILDSSSWEVVSDEKNFNKPKVKTLVIDHHDTNESFGDVNLIDPKVTSTAELIFSVFQDWGVDVNKDVAQSLLTGILGDTGAFRFPGVGAKTLKLSAFLIENGADKEEIIKNLYMSEPFELFKFYARVLDNMRLDKKGKFVWSYICYKDYKKYDNFFFRESAASLFAPIVEGTDFGFVAVEQKPKVTSVSFRSRTGFDSSRIAKALGGGGHIYASGAKIEGLPLSKSLKLILKVARKFAKIKNR